VRVLYCTGGGVGNVVMSTPAIAALADSWHTVDVWLEPGTPEGTIDLLRGFGAIRGVLSGRPPVLDEYEHVVHSVWSRTRLRHRKELFAPTVPGMLRTRHESAVNMCPIRNALGFTGPTPAPHVELNAPPPAVQADRPYVVLAPGCKEDAFWRRKRWDAARWSRLADIILGEGELRVAWLGTLAQVPIRERGAWERNLCGKTTLAEAASIIACAKAVVAIDNGLAHVAAALGVPTVVMFGATSEIKNAPRGPKVKILTRDINCRPCQMTRIWHRCTWDESTGWPCMDFEAEEVAEAATRLAGAVR